MTKPSIIDTLFTDDLPLVNTKKELDAVLEKYNRDPYYIASSCIQERKDKLDALWCIFKDHCDSHFLSQYKHIGKFHQRTWEMYVWCVLLEKWFTITAQNEWPDFLVNNQYFLVNSQYYVECIACKQGDWKDKVPDNSIGIDDMDKKILRIINAIKTKIDQFIEIEIDQFHKIPNNKPYIIAINTAELWYLQDIDIPLIIKALFGVEYLQVNQHWEESLSWRDFVVKQNLASVDVNIFTNDSHKEIMWYYFLWSICN